MNFLDPKTLAIGIISTAIMFTVIAFFTRATLRRIAGALVGALPIIPLVMFFDSLAARMGWWHYPSLTTGLAPIAWYIAAALFYGAALGLVGWRVARRWDRRGLVIFLVVLALFGVTRDYLYSLTTNLIIFGPGPLPLIADLLAYASAGALVQLLMFWIAGAPRSDRLARKP